MKGCWLWGNVVTWHIECIPHSPMLVDGQIQWRQFSYYWVANLWMWRDHLNQWVHFEVDRRLKHDLCTQSESWLAGWGNYYYVRQSWWLDLVTTAPHIGRSSGRDDNWVGSFFCGSLRLSHDWATTHDCQVSHDSRLSHDWRLTTVTTARLTTARCPRPRLKAADPRLTTTDGSRA